MDQVTNFDTSQADAASKLMTDPIEFFGYSVTNMHGIARNALEELQVKALKLRFEQQKERIPALAKLANLQGIRSVNEFDEVLPVCFEHTILKSYPMSLLENNRFDKMTIWMDRLTPHDLSKIDASKCDSIDSWLDLIAEGTELDPACSSGTTGAMSFTPKERSEWRTSTLCLRAHLLQKFGDSPTQEDLHEQLHVIWPGFSDGHVSSFRRPQYLLKYFAGGAADYFHPMYHAKGSTDIMFLAARLRAAASRGDTRIDVAPGLLARRAELEKLRSDMASGQVEWVETLTQELTGKRVMGMGTWNLLHDVASKQLEKGNQCHFAPNSVLVWGGGAKGLTMPADWQETIRRFYNVELSSIYGMSEQNCYYSLCKHERYHIVPWSIPFVLDPETGKSLPRSGVKTGRAAFFDLSQSAAWGGLISGDEVQIDWETPCKCGRNSVHISRQIQRYSEKQGGDDKISCAATPQAHAEAMEFITSF
jgi:hypothetical protein